MSCSVVKEAMVEKEGESSSSAHINREEVFRNWVSFDNDEEESSEKNSPKVVEQQFVCATC